MTFATSTAPSVANAASSTASANNAGNLLTQNGPLGTSTLSNLTNNTFLTRANDKLAVKDIYTGVDGKSILTSVKNALENLDLSFADVLRGGKWIASNIPLLSSVVRQGTAVFDQKGLIARVLGASNLSTGLLSKLSSGATDGLLGSIKDNQQVFASINGVIQRVGSTNLSDLNAIGGLVNHFTGDNNLFKVNDLDGQAGFVAGLIHDCTSFGIPNSFQALTSRLTNTNLVNQVASRVLPDIINASDTHSLAAIASSLGNKSTYSLNPGVISDFASKYSLPNLTSGQSGTLMFQDVMGAFRQIDSHWDTGTRTTSAGDSTHIDLTSLMSGSDTFKALLKQVSQTSSDPTQRLYQLANVFQSSSVTDSLKKSFPKTVFQPNQVANSFIVDPTLLASNPALALQAVDTSTAGA